MTMTGCDQIDVNALNKLNEALEPASGLSHEELLARINGMTMREVVEDAIQMAITGPCLPARECIPDVRNII